MAAFRTATPDQAAFLDELIAHGLLLPSGVPGVYGRGATFEAVRTGIDDLVTRASADEGAEPMRFPPVVPRRQIETSGYLKSFPHLAGSVFAFEGTEGEAAALHDAACRHEDWSGYQTQSDLDAHAGRLLPGVPGGRRARAAARRRRDDRSGGSYAFRREPSNDPARLQMFHMRELVRIGEPETVTAWRDLWRDEALQLLRAIGLQADFDVANDPFFGRRGAFDGRQPARAGAEVRDPGPRSPATSPPRSRRSTTTRTTSAPRTASSSPMAACRTRRASASAWSA